MINRTMLRRTVASLLAIAVTAGLTGCSLRELKNGKPGHASIITLRPCEPWTEAAYWEPDQRAP